MLILNSCLLRNYNVVVAHYISNCVLLSRGVYIRTYIPQGQGYIKMRLCSSLSFYQLRKCLQNR